VLSESKLEECANCTALGNDISAAEVLMEEFTQINEKLAVDPH
jgi:hypothetical protein